MKVTLLADGNETDLQKAINLLEEIFRAMKLKVFVKICKGDLNEQTIEISGEDSSKCIGKHGKVLDALETVINASVPIRIKLDALNYRQRRKEVLKKLAKSTARQVKLFRKEIKLDAMSRADRKVIHETLQENEFVSSRSDGVEPYRRVIIYLKPDA